MTILGLEFFAGNRIKSSEMPDAADTKKNSNSFPPPAPFFFSLANYEFFADVPPTTSVVFSPFIPQGIIMAMSVSWGCCDKPA